MKKEKYYSKETLSELSTLCELLKNENVHSVRTLSKGIASIFKDLGYDVTYNNRHFIIERETEEIEDDGYWM